MIRALLALLRRRPAPEPPVITDDPRPAIVATTRGGWASVAHDFTRGETP